MTKCGHKSSDEDAPVEATGCIVWVLIMLIILALVVLSFYAPWCPVKG